MSEMTEDWKKQSTQDTDVRWWQPVQWLTKDCFLLVENICFKMINFGYELQYKNKQTNFFKPHCNKIDSASLSLWLWLCSGEEKGNPLQYSCLENSIDRQRSLMGYSSWSCRESDRTEWLTHTHFIQIGSGGLVVILYIYWVGCCFLLQARILE